MRSRSIAAVVLLALVAVAGVIVVRELTQPVPSVPVDAIRLDPGVPAGEGVEDDKLSRGKRRGEGSDDGGFQPPSAAPEEPDAAPAPETPPPEIEVETPEAESDDDGGGD